MAELITDKLSTPTGSLHVVPWGTCCDNHPNDPATHRVQGVTDAISAMMHDFCDFCYQRYQMQEVEQEGESCEWCLNPSNQLSDYRDLKEGLLGEICKVCPRCIHENQSNIIDDVPTERQGFNVRNADDDNDDDAYFLNEDNGDHT